jgi:alkanesulfonate monooxygenase
MSIEFIWQLPTGGDARYGTEKPERRGERVRPGRYFSDDVTDPRGTRFNYLDYLHQVARAADLSGFDGIQIRNDPQGDESWIVAGYLARSTRHVRLLTEFDASRGSAVYAAKNAVSYQRHTRGRFAWQIGTGGTREQRRSQGDFAEDADVIPRIEEFITVARGVLTSGTYNFKGKYFEVLNGGFKGPLSNSPLPRIYLSGNTAEAYELSAKVADVHVFDGLPPDQLEAEIRKLEDLGERRSHPLHLGLRLSVLARESEAEARADAAHFPGQPVVGSYAKISGLLADYVKAGIGSFILAASPHLEEAYRVGEHVLPAVRRLITPSGRDAA